MKYGIFHKQILFEIIVHVYNNIIYFIQNSLIIKIGTSFFSLKLWYYHQYMCWL